MEVEINGFSDYSYSYFCVNNDVAFFILSPTIREIVSNVSVRKTTTLN